MPNPIRESGVAQFGSLLAMIPSLALRTLNPSLLQWPCRRESRTRLIHVAREADVARNFPSAMSACNDAPLFESGMKRVSESTVIPTQSLVKGVLQ